MSVSEGNKGLKKHFKHVVWSAMKSNNSVKKLFEWVRRSIRTSDDASIAWCALFDQFIRYAVICSHLTKLWEDWTVKCSLSLSLTFSLPFAFAWFAYNEYSLERANKLLDVITEVICNGIILSRLLGKQSILCVYAAALQLWSVARDRLPISQW